MSEAIDFHTKLNPGGQNSIGEDMRLMEGMRLRVKDIDFDHHVIIVREATGRTEISTVGVPTDPCGTAVLTVGNSTPLGDWSDLCNGSYCLASVAARTMVATWQ